MTRKDERKIGSLLERASRNEDLHLHPEDAGVFAVLECIRESLSNRWPLSEDEQDVLIDVIDDYLLAARRGPQIGAMRERDPLQ